MGTIPEIKPKSAGPVGVSASPESSVAGRGKVVVSTFMLEDYLDSIEAKLALNDPDNSERVRWEQLKERLGL
jgi:hypothetical protein